MHKILQPDGWARPKGYANGIAASGRLVFVSGQIGWNSQSEFESDELIAQVRQTLNNVVAVLAEADAKPEHIASMTWYFTDKSEYLANLKAIGQVYRDVIGSHYSAMTAIEVKALIEDRAKVEIQVMAVIPQPAPSEADL
jgi:enamine deaminase RidA (YjgF/YER057c/UK114 family)